MSWAWATGGALVGAGATVAVLMWIKKRELEEKVEHEQKIIQQIIETGGTGKNEFERSVAQVRKRLIAFGTSYATELGEQTVRDHLARTYFMTPETASKLSALGGALSRLTV